MTNGKTPSRLALDRRRYLQAAGACIALPSLRNERAWSVAADSKLPKSSSDPRMVCIGVALGMHGNEWVPKEVGTAYKAPKLIEPLEKLRNDFTIFSNVDHPNVKGGSGRNRESEHEGKKWVRDLIEKICTNPIFFE